MGARETDTGSASLQTLLHEAHATEAGALIGLEHEYQLSLRGTIVDFGAMIHDLAVPGARLDPGDWNAYRCHSGLAITADDREAEVASPPLAVGPRFASSVDGWAHTGRALLRQIIPPDLHVDGFSTHLSVAVPDRHADAVVDLLVHRFAPALMMVLDRPDSHGIFLRPRPSRMELCGEYAIGSRLRAAAALFAGAARACVAAAARPGGQASPLPPHLGLRARPTDGRYGVEIDRHRAFGLDLYDRARETVLPLQDGGTITAQAHLELAWRCARASLAPCSGPTDVDSMDRIVSGASPLGVDPVPQATPEPDAAPMTATPFGRLLGRRDRGAYAVVPIMATWSFTVFGLRAGGGRRFVCVPRSSLGRFLDLLDTGALDDVLGAHVRSPFAGRVLSTFAQTQHPGTWDAIGDPARLLPPEREPVAAPGSRTAPGAKPARLGKPFPGPHPAAAVPRPASVASPTPVQPAGPGPLPASPRSRLWLRPLAAALGALLLALLAGVAFATGIFDRNDDRVVETAPASSTTVVAATTTVAPTTVGPTTTGDPPTTTTAPPAPSTTATVAPTTTAITATTVPPPASSIPATTAVATTVPTTTAPEPTTTTLPPTTTIPPVTTVAVDNCAFTPTSLSRPQGSTVRFANQSATATITLSVTGPPGSSDAFFSLEPGGTSGPFVLNVGGTYVFRCTGAGAGAGQMAITAT